MKKVVLGTIAALMLAGTVNAGEVAYVAPAPAPMMESEPMGSSGAWIIPLIALGLIIFAVTQDSNNE